MSGDDLGRRLRAYQEMVDEGQEPVELSELAERAPAVRPVPVPPLRRRGVFVALAAAAATFAVFAAVMVLVAPLGSDDPALVATMPATSAPTTTASPDAWCRPPPEARQLKQGISAVGPDGSVWHAADDGLLGSADGAEFASYPVPFDDMHSPFGVAAAADGSVWLFGRSVEGFSQSGIARFDPSTGVWQAVRPLGVAVPAADVAATCGGPLWALLTEWEHVDAEGVRWTWDAAAPAGAVDPVAEVPGEWWLARIDGSRVEVVPFSLGSVVRPDPGADAGDAPGPPLHLVVDEHAVWVMQGRTMVAGYRFSGVARYGGDRWTRTLDGEVVVDLLLHEDGTVTAVTLEGSEVHIKP